MNGFVKAAVSIQIGVRKTPPVRSGRLTSDSGESPEQIALDELGAMDLMRRAGVRSVPTAPLPPAPSEGSRIAAAALPLAEALESSLPAALEWAAEAARRGFVAPPENLATLVSLSARYPAFIPVLGERGRWLADAMGVALPAHTPVGRPDQNAFDAMAWRERADALLEWGKPTPADETMLGRALEDRRKEVREAALDLLLKLDDSSPARAIRALATAAVEIRKSFLRTDLQVVPPDPRNLPAWLPRTTSRPGTGESGLALLDVVRRTPPSFWDRSVLDLIAWAEKTEYSEILTAAWEEAALRFEDNSWIDALYSRSTFSIPANAPLFAKNASDEAFEIDASKRLRAQPERWGDLAQGTIAFRGRPLSPKLSRAIVEAMEMAVYERYAYKELALWLDLSVLPALEAPWGKIESVEPQREYTHRLLDLRRRLRESLR